jgi:hypothetical protein
VSNSRAHKNRAIRQEELRKQLSEQCRLQHLIDNLIKIENLDPESDTFNNELAKYKEANAQRIKLMSKYIPDLKAVEVTGEGGGGLTIKVTEYTSDD